MSLHHTLNYNLTSYSLHVLYSDEDQGPPRPGGAGAIANNNRSNARNSAAPSNRGGGTPDCQCGEEAVERTVSKDGPNKGKVFFACPKSRDDATNCKFFEWSDSAPSAPARGNSNSNFNPRPAPSTSRAGPSADPGDPPECNCGDEAVERTVSKEGANQGKKFWSCSKPQSGGSCGFFAWIEGNGSGGGGGAPSRVVPAKRRVSRLEEET